MKCRLKRFAGQYRRINDRGVPVYDSGDFIGYIGSCMDVTEKIDGQLFKEQAQKDGLCQIYNRFYFEKILEHEIAAAHRQESNIAVIMLDIDDFKTVNDRYGHITGDKVLQQIALTIKESIGEVDSCGRYGGEEFIAVLVGANLRQAVEIAEKIRNKIAEKLISVNFTKKFIISVTVSSGVSCLHTADSRKELIQRAAQGLYLAKRSGKNCVKTVQNA
jgi:diguanylate cyclase (GGDEF) domain